MNNLHLVTDAEIDAQFRYDLERVGGLICRVVVWRKGESMEWLVGEITLPLFTNSTTLHWTEKEAHTIARQLARLYIKKTNT